MTLSKNKYCYAKKVFSVFQVLVLKIVSVPYLNLPYLK